MTTKRRVPGGSVLRAAVRPETLPGHLREAASLAITMAVYPFGRVDRGLHDLRRKLQEDDGRIRTPVLLVHGFGANKSNWFFLERELRSAGFGVIHALNYNPLRADIPELADQCVARARELMAHTGSDRIHLIGHSLGGIIVRYAVAVGGLEQAATCVSIASPHQGVRMARFALGRGVPSQLAPDSDVLRRMRAAPRRGTTRFVAYYSNLDVIVPGWRAQMREPHLGATNVLVKDEGHLSIMLSRRLADSVVDQLCAAEGLPGYGTVESLARARGRRRRLWRAGEKAS